MISSAGTPGSQQNRREVLAQNPDRHPRYCRRLSSLRNCWLRGVDTGLVPHTTTLVGFGNGRHPVALLAVFPGRLVA